MNENDVFKALVLPLHREEVEFRAPAFFLRARPNPELEPWRGGLECAQGYKPDHDALIQAGYKTADSVEGRYGLGLCLVTKHKAETLANLARGWSLLDEGGVMLAAGPNSLGAASIAREVEQVLGLEGSLSKHQCRVFWFCRRGDTMPPELAGWIDASAPMPVGEGALVSRAGSFCAGRVDAGSRLLAERLPQEVGGRVADLGAGWGYLSWHALNARPDVSHVDLYEAESLSLADAKVNLSPWTGKVAFHWHDVTQGLPKVQPYDWIIANPPFHEGRKADPALGRAFIAAAWGAIRRRGKFLMVANRALPYEHELHRRFRDVLLLAERDGYKLLLASDRRERALPS